MSEHVNSDPASDRSSEPASDRSSDGSSDRSSDRSAAPKRPYSSTLRADQARLTRDRILAAAEELFLADGYGTTTIARVARQAGVAADTVYATFGSKQGILKALMDARVAGDTAPVPLLDRPGIKAAAAQPDHVQRAEFAADGITAIHERARRIDDLMLSAAGSDAEIAALRSDIQQRQRLEGMRYALISIKGADPLRAGLDDDEATDILWALTGPDLHRLFRDQRHWTADQYRRWLADAIQRLLFD
jgi:AcrR family transcriptional regulator